MQTIRSLTQSRGTLFVLLAFAIAAVLALGHTLSVELTARTPSPHAVQLR